MVHDGPWPRRFDRAAITVENTATAEGLDCAIQSTDDYGHCTSVAIHFQPAALPLLQMYTMGITFHAARADSCKHLPAVLDIVASGRLAPPDVPTTVVAWGEAVTTWLSPATTLVLVR